MSTGAVVEYQIRLSRVPLRWKALIERFEPDECFVDVQLKGPYRYWRHSHLFEEIEGGTRTRDVVEYELGFGPFGTMAHALFVRRQLDGIFAHRTKVLTELFGPLS